MEGDIALGLDWDGQLSGPFHLLVEGPGLGTGFSQFGVVLPGPGVLVGDHGRRERQFIDVVGVENIIAWIGSEQYPGCGRKSRLDQTVGRTATLPTTFFECPGDSTVSGRLRESATTTRRPRAGLRRGRRSDDLIWGKTGSVHPKQGRNPDGANRAVRVDLLAVV